MSTEKETFQTFTANLREVLTKEITEEVRQTLSKLLDKLNEIVCVVIVDKKCAVEVLTVQPVKIMIEEPSDSKNTSDVQDPGFRLEKKGECIWFVTLTPDVRSGALIDHSKVCIYDSRRPECPVNR